MLRLSPQVQVVSVVQLRGAETCFAIQTCFAHCMNVFSEASVSIMPEITGVGCPGKKSCVSNEEVGLATETVGCQNSRQRSGPFRFLGLASWNPVPISVFGALCPKTSGGNIKQNAHKITCKPLKSLLNLWILLQNAWNQCETS